MRRLISDSDKCGDCGAVVVHEDARDDDSPEAEEAAADYFVRCTNADCAHAKGEFCSDQECPPWAHGRKS